MRLDKLELHTLEMQRICGELSPLETRLLEAYKEDASDADLEVEVENLEGELRSIEDDYESLKVDFEQSEDEVATLRTEKEELVNELRDVYTVLADQDDPTSYRVSEALQFIINSDYYEEIKKS